MIVVALLCGGCMSTSSAAQEEVERPVFGTLISLPEHSVTEAEAGIDAAMVELYWSEFEPKKGKFDSEYIREIQQTTDDLLATGRSVTLGLGLHYTPRWVFDLPNSRFINQDGERSDEPNFVFNQQLRVRAERYIAAVADVLDFTRIDTVRLTSGGNAEILFPEGGSYWAFDENAQNGDDMPPSMPPNPAPGWRPRDGNLSTDEVHAWADWYIGALRDVVLWQAQTFADHGFRGSYELLTPGVGVQPRAYERAIEAGLPDGLLGVGAAWAEFYGQLPRRPDFVAYISSVADGSGDDDLCTSDDDSVPLDSSEVENWSATRWVSRIADYYGFRKGGENPGWHQHGSESYEDTSENGMMAAALRQVQACGLERFYWAHDTQLWDGTVPFDLFAERIDDVTLGPSAMNLTADAAPNSGR
jgi:hypothetical protein